MPVIDYAPVRPWYRRAFTPRRIFRIFVFLILALGSVAVLVRAVVRIEVYSWERRAARFSSSPATVALMVPGPPPARGAPLELVNAVYAVWSPWELGSPVFLHQLQSPAGPRLVYMSTVADSFDPRTASDYDPRYQLVHAVMVPSNPIEGPKIPENYKIWGLPAKRAFTSICIFTGELDPADPSCFTVAVELDGTRHIVRFQINATGTMLEQVSITPPI